jgi:7,8-dihydroneopterin aldolase/epimerase/oxygenase
MTSRIHLQNMVFFGYHGHFPAENALGQRFEVDLVLDIDLTAAMKSDDLADTVDYAAVFTLCRQTVEGERCKLIEALAGRIIDRILIAWPRITGVRIIIRKPGAPVPGALDAVAVEISRTRA